MSPLAVSNGIDNPTIPLEPDSQYISTQFLISAGFHWALLITNSKGLITRHEWAEDLSRETAEKYFHRVINAATSYTEDGKLIFAYFKVSGYKFPGVEFDWVDMLGRIFRTSYSTSSWIDNRKHHMSCRTWILRALGRLRDQEMLSRSGTVADIEGTITTH